MATSQEVWSIKNEIFSDGTPTQGRPSGKGLQDFSPDWVKEVQARRNKPRKHINANPGAAQIWQQERVNGAPWRERSERLQQIEDEKAMREHAHKRITLLSKQACSGLKVMYNAQFDVAEMIPLLKQAEKEMGNRKQDKILQSLLQAVLRNDIKAVATLLKAYTTTKASTPCLGISTRLVKVAQYLTEQITVVFFSSPPVPLRISAKGLS
eukprot:CAMPEP_0204824974 /NCGR_PEP_ID=MMETSP1346-20131115/2954_1 /ASSEMBLY_ACC=CAM_ASM_000771 /TAXON_ID=215587 /ORGANISM="Aplanochytrium stocchinoi, Strain GSBS06" /LENGTH=209 /DNA_ID=CAMNT_0051952429 /DNA_START=45 /DNA_END=674 /DNA_ORIENTATION=+